MLIQVLNSSKPLEYALQIKAAQALAETSDRQALNEIEKWARGETRSYQRRRVGIIVSGGNVDYEVLAAL
ncbi:MAG: hypothetical protein IT168_24250 [Bryobacterales bacterium]|nr:hypothetical protein [Bryobacterales bacterium]